jgi:hypothetical protein
MPFDVALLFSKTMNRTRHNMVVKHKTPIVLRVRVVFITAHAMIKDLKVRATSVGDKTS